MIAQRDDESEKEFVNRLRERSLQLARAFRELFANEDAVRRTVWQRLFLAAPGTPRRVGEYALSDLKAFCFAEDSGFHSDALKMAERAGRRAVWLRITNYLNLDETTVRKLMEIDDGIGQ